MSAFAKTQPYLAPLSSPPDRAQRTASVAEKA